MQTSDSTTVPGFLPARIGNGPVTMSSREIAELVNTTHDSVMKTVRRLVAEGVVSGNETPYVHPQNGQSYPEFKLDYRNTMVVASGYSAMLRAKIIDRWIEIETGTVQPLTRSAATAELASLFSSMKKIARTAGLTGNQSIISAAQATHKVAGTNPLALIDATHLAAPQPEALLTPSDIGARLGGIKAQAVNGILTDNEFQTANRDRKKRLYYEPTDKGLKAGAVMSDTGKKQGDGTPIRQLRWSGRIVEILRSLIGGRA